MINKIEGSDDDGTFPCEDCVKAYGESRNLGGSHYHCSNCGLISSYQGHFTELSEGNWGFKCPKT